MNLSPKDSRKLIEVLNVLTECSLFDGDNADKLNLMEGVKALKIIEKNNYFLRYLKSEAELVVDRFETLYTPTKTEKKL